MIYLSDTAPFFCPNCGRNSKMDSYMRHDFYSGCSRQCPCGAQVQYVETIDLLMASQKNKQGDLVKYNVAAFKERKTS